MDDDEPPAGSAALDLVDICTVLKPTMQTWQAGPSDADDTIVFSWMSAYSSWLIRDSLGALGVLHKIAWDEGAG